MSQQLAKAVKDALDHESPIYAAAIQKHKDANSNSFEFLVRHELIALEALTGDDGATGEHIWKVGMRSALLATKSLTIRKEIRDVIKQIYDIRSQVMHNGIISKKHERGATELVQKGIVKCASIISSVIKRGGLPENWSVFELSSGKL